MARKLVVVTLGLVALAGTAATAGAQSACLSGKLKAMAKWESALLGCRAKEVATGDVSPVGGFAHVA